MNELDHARAMLLLAQKDQRALRGMLDEEVFAEEIFGFHAQQAESNRCPHLCSEQVANLFHQAF